MNKIWELLTRRVWEEGMGIGEFTGFYAGKREAERILETTLDQYAETEFESGLMLALELLWGYDLSSTEEDE